MNLMLNTKIKKIPTTFLIRFIICFSFFITALTGISSLANAHPYSPKYYGDDSAQQKDQDTFALLAHAHNLIDNSLYTFQNIMARQDRPTIIKLLKRAKGILIFPHVYSGGFLIGGSGGTGVLLAKADNNEWSYPGFYNMASASFGLQFGAQSTKVIFLLMSDKALGSVMHNSFTFGGSMGLSIGTIGSSIGGSTTTNAGADVIMFSLTNAGIFAGIKLQSASINPNNDLNHVFYTPQATDEDIVLNGRYGNPAADPLRHAIENYTLPHVEQQAQKVSPYALDPNSASQTQKIYNTPSAYTPPPAAQSTTKTITLPARPATATQPPAPTQTPQQPTRPYVPQTTSPRVSQQEQQIQEPRQPQKPATPNVSTVEPTRVPHTQIDSSQIPFSPSVASGSTSSPQATSPNNKEGHASLSNNQELPQQTVITP